MRDLVLRVLLGLLIPLVVVLSWHWAASSGAAGGLVPSVGAVLEIVLHPTRVPETVDVPPLWFSVQTSLLRVLLGFSLAVVVGVPLGLVMGRSGIVRAIVGPAANMAWIVSPIAWIPVAILLLGIAPVSDLLYGELHGWRHPRLYEIQPAMVLAVGWGAFLPILSASASAAAGVRRSLLEAARLMDAGPWFRLRRVVLPYALPEIMAGARVGFGMAWRVIVAAELYPGTRSGLGYTIEVSLTDGLQYDYAFAAILYIMVIGLVLSGLLWLLERHVGHWRSEQR